MSLDAELGRGDVVTIADRRNEFGGKPRPAIIMQRAGTAALLTVTVCLLTSIAADAPALRIAVPATAATGLESPSWAMIERVTTVRRHRIGNRIGRAGDATMLAIGRALLMFLGLA